MPDIFKTAAHTPAHLFRINSFYIVTGSTYQKQVFIGTEGRKAQWRDAFFKASELYHWHIIAWVVLDNHYHVILKSPEESADGLPKLIASLHKFTARQWNDEDKVVGRKVWWNYWDTCIRSEIDFETRLRYVLWNPVKHGLVERPQDYSFSNYSDFLIAGVPLEPMVEVNDVPEF